MAAAGEIVLLLGDDTAYLLFSNDRQARGLNALAYRIFEVLLETGAVLGTDARSPVGQNSVDPPRPTHLIGTRTGQHHAAAIT